MLATSAVVRANDETIKSIEAELTSIAATSLEAQQLRARPEIHESRSVLRIAPEHREKNLTETTLRGPHKIEVPPFVFADNEKGTLVAFYHLGCSLEGHAGILHGGIAAVLLDEVMGRSCFPLLANQIAVTANLNLNYRAPVVLSSYVVVRGVTQSVRGNKAIVKGSIESPDGKLLVEAEGLWIDPKFGKTMSKMM